MASNSVRLFLSKPHQNSFVRNLLGVPLVSCGQDCGGPPNFAIPGKKSPGGKPNGSIHWIGCLSKETSAPHSRWQDHRGARNVRRSRWLNEKLKKNLCAKETRRAVTPKSRLISRPWLPPVSPQRS